MHVWIEGKWENGGERMVGAGEMAGKLVGRSKSGAILKLRTLCPRTSVIAVYLYCGSVTYGFVHLSRILCGKVNSDNNELEESKGKKIYFSMSVYLTKQNLLSWEETSLEQ